MPANELIRWATRSLEPDRDIYVYGETDDETAAAATLLRQSGFLNVSELRGGMAAWKAVGYPLESLNTFAA